MRKLKNSELNRLSTSAYKSAKKTPITIVLDNIRSLNNIGSVFRTADAFLVEEIILCGITAQPPHKDITKTALGATESVNWRYFNETLEALEYLKHHRKIAIEQTENATMLNNFQPKIEEPIALIFGNEVKGVSQKVIDVCDTVIEIPQYGTKHSLNISVSVGVCLWDVFQKIKARS
ncbi:RNA methyltransferase [Psychroflexus sp. ALD_RP9]|uniref:RNA methyltransferase n=1 Tax=Psychroflexus sp. ALD_RP9 TaxID=2777186 RepID=UPI001A8D84E7|nr:RNA methyltransferase [Psychroflexus sp. ALD_RP9]QSS97102.1 RNA methyltransferase [Psychroflexus sp. ALD_RP9]